MVIQNLLFWYFEYVFKSSKIFFRLLTQSKIWDLHSDDDDEIHDNDDGDSDDKHDGESDDNNEGKTGEFDDKNLDIDDEKNNYDKDDDDIDNDHSYKNVSCFEPSLAVFSSWLC